MYNNSQSMNNIQWGNNWDLLHTGRLHLLTVLLNLILKENPIRYWIIIHCFFHVSTENKLHFLNLSMPISIGGIQQNHCDL